MYEAEKKMAELAEENMTPELKAQFDKWKEEIDDLALKANFQKEPEVRALADKVLEQIKAINMFLMENIMPREVDGKLEQYKLTAEDREKFVERRYTYRWFLQLLVGAEQALKDYAASIDDAVAKEDELISK
jgi:hypothetical protein